MRLSNFYDLPVEVPNNVEIAENLIYVKIKDYFYEDKRGGMLEVESVKLTNGLIYIHFNDGFYWADFLSNNRNHTWDTFIKTITKTGIPKTNLSKSLYGESK